MSIRIPVLFDGNFDELQQKLEGNLSKTAAALTGTGKALTKGLTLPLLAVGTAATNEFGKFEKSLFNLEQLVGLTKDEIDAISPSIKSIGAAAGIGPAEAADAFFFLQSGIGDTEKSLDALEAATKGAAVGLGDTETISRALVSVFGAYGDEVADATTAMNVFGTAAQQSVLGPDEMASSLQTIIPLAAEMGVGLDDLAGTMALISGDFASGAEASTAMGATMRALINPSQQANKILGESGKEAVQTALETEGLVAAMRELQNQTGGNTEEMAKVLGSSEALRFALSALGADSDDVASILEATGAAMNGLEGDTFDLDQAMESMEETSGFKMQQALTQLKLLLTDLGAAIVPVIIPAFEKLTAGIQRATEMFNNLSPRVQTFIVQAALVAAAVGPVLLIVGKMLAIFGAIIGPILKIVKVLKILIGVFKVLTAVMLANPFALIVVAIAALAIGLVLLWKRSETFRNIVLGAWEAIKVASIATFEFIKNLISGVWDFITALFSFTPIGIVIQHWDSIRQATVDAWEAVKSALSAAFDFIANIFLNFTGPGLIIKHWDTIREVTTRTFDAVLEVITGAWDAVSKVISTVVKVVTKVVRTGFQLIRAVVTTQVRLVQTIVTTVWNAISSVVTRVIRAIQGAVSRGWSAIRDSTSSAWAAIRGVVSDQISRVLDLVRGLPGRIKSALGGLKTLLSSAGRDLIQGLINGIRGMASSLRSAVTSVVSDNVPGPVKKILGISSPSKLFEEIGRDTALGMAKGLEGSAGLIRTATERFLTPSPASLRTSSGGRGSVSAQPPEVHVYIDGQEFRGMIRVQQQEHDRTLRRSLVGGTAGVTA